MKKKGQIAALNTLLKKMKVRIKAFLLSENKEELHQFRVEVKKLKAILTLYACEKKNKNLLKDFKPVKEVFAKAGDIRNAHIHLQLGQKHRLEEKFHQQQQKLLQNSLEDFKKKGNKYLKAIKKVKLKLQNDTHQLHNKIIRGFYQKKITEIEAFFANLTFDEDLHTARKNIKLLIYNQKIIASAISNKLPFNLKYLDELQDSVGEWHDHNLTIDFLVATGNAEDAKTIKLKSDNQDLENTIINLSQNFKEKVMAVTEVIVKNELV